MKLLDLILGAIVSRFSKLASLARLYQNMNQITKHVWIGGINHPKFIIQNTFNDVMDLREKNSAKYKIILENHGISYYNIKITDRWGTSPQTIYKIVCLIFQKAKKNRKILVHCNLGRGRSALILGAYLICLGIKLENSIKEIKVRRTVTYLNSKQMEALEEFNNWITIAKIK